MTRRRSVVVKIATYVSGLILSTCIVLIMVRLLSFPKLNALSRCKH